MVAASGGGGGKGGGKGLVFVGSWDNCVYTYNVRTDAAGRCSAAQEVGIARLPQPAMDITYGAMNTPYANMAFAACADNGVYMVQNGTAVQKIGAFAAPV